MESTYQVKRPFKFLYNSARWYRVLRPAILHRDPVCTECKRRQSDTVDHIRDHRGDAKMFFDPNNCRGLCSGCHNKKTGSEHGKGGRKPKFNPIDENGRIRKYD